jgi:hypothetical protein
VLTRYAAYMEANRTLPDGSRRATDNWQMGIPKDAYIKSMFRHFIDLWSLHRGVGARSDKEDAVCGIIFNAMGYLFELLKGKNTA